jgi:DNA-binding response OmpR family regulator
MPVSVLLADDDLELSNMLAQYLRRDGFDVTLVHDGEAAVAAARTDEHAAVVLDVMMPKLDGIEALRRIRAHLSGTTRCVSYLQIRRTRKASEIS